MKLFLSNKYDQKVITTFIFCGTLNFSIHPLTIDLKVCIEHWQVLVFVLLAGNVERRG